jgi:hypothetical protein
MLVGNPTAVWAAEPVDGNGPPCTIDSVTVTPVGILFMSSRPQRGRKRAAGQLPSDRRHDRFGRHGVEREHQAERTEDFVQHAAAERGGGTRAAQRGSDAGPAMRAHGRIRVQDRTRRAEPLDLAAELACTLDAEQRGIIEGIEPGREARHDAFARGHVRDQQQPGLGAELPRPERHALQPCIGACIDRRRIGGHQPHRIHARHLQVRRHPDAIAGCLDRQASTSTAREGHRTDR